MDLEIYVDDDLIEGAMRAVEAAGRKILLARVEGQHHAVGNECPHAGAPLTDGVLQNGVVICPWHKAAFCVTTGRRTEPPAVDDLPRYSVRFVDGRLAISIPEQDPDQLDPIRELSDPRCMVVIGAGAAGALAAQTLRETGFLGRLVLVGQEAELPYDRTLLSKYVLSGKKGGEKTPLQNADYYKRNRIERLTGTVVSVDPALRRISLADGTDLSYDQALIATGGVARPLTIPGHELRGVHLLRTPADAEAIVGVAQKAKRAVVIGAGFIGLEAAASLRERGLDVTIVAPQATPLERQLGPEVGNIFRKVHEREGVVFHMGQEVQALEGENGHVDRVRLKSGVVLQADLVVAGLGIVLSTDILKGGVRDKDGGLEVDANLKIADGLYAGGDIAAFPLFGDGPRVRVEHWRVAEQHGKVAARNMLGKNEACDAVPVFWTISFLKRLDYIGHATSWDEVIIEGDLETPEFLAFYIENSCVKALAGWGRDRQMAAAVDLMTKKHDWTITDLREALPL